MYAKAIWKLYRVKALCCNEKENLRDWVFATNLIAKANGIRAHRLPTPCQTKISIPEE